MPKTLNLNTIKPFILNILFIYLFIFRERKGERKRERHKRCIDWLPLARPQLGTQPAAQACALTGNRTGDLSIHRPALNPLRYTSQDQSSLLTQLPVYRKYRDRGTSKMTLRETQADPEWGYSERKLV